MSCGSRETTNGKEHEKDMQGKGGYRAGHTKKWFYLVPRTCLPGTWGLPIRNLHGDVLAHNKHA